MSRRTDGRAVCLFLALVSLVVFFAPSNSCAQQVVGTVTKLSGSAQIQRAGATIAVVQGMSVELHDRLATSLNSSATVTLASGITLTLAEHTNLTFDQNVTTAGTGRTQLNLVEGGLRSLVPPLLRTQSFRNSYAQCDHRRARHRLRYHLYRGRRTTRIRGMPAIYRRQGAGRRSRGEQSGQSYAGG